MRDPAEMFRQMPHGRTIMLRDAERRWWIGRKESSRTIATVLAPPGPLLDGDAARR